MKFIDIKNREISVNYKVKEPYYKSKIQKSVGDFLFKELPYQAIWHEFVIPGSRMSLDFLLPKKRIAIEVDGEQHQKHIVHFHGKIGKGGFAKQMDHDMQKQEWCNLNNIILFRFTKTDNFADLLKKIENA